MRTHQVAFDSGAIIDVTFSLLNECDSLVLLSFSMDLLKMQITHLGGDRTGRIDFLDFFFCFCISVNALSIIANI